MLIHPDTSCLLVIDLQEKLMPALHKPKRLLKHSRWLIEIANHLHIPVWATEQYPQGLGSTLKSLQELIPAERILSKTHFSAAAESEVRNALNAQQYNQFVIIGAEAHVCVLQTALQLKQQAREVFVVEDCISSRRPEDKALALERFRQAGIQVVSREMVAFEWLRKADTDAFRYISRNYLRNL